MRISVILVVTALIGLSGCITSRQPYLSDAAMTPSDLKPGDTALITVVVNDEFGIVHEVRGIVEEDRTIQFHFRDDGESGDETAGDNIWSMKVDVPPQAPPGGFTFEISAYDQNDNLIVVRDENKEAVGMTTSFTLDITYPESSTGVESGNDSE